MVAFILFILFEDSVEMPQKELVDPCSDCREFESILTQRNRRLCQSVDPVDHPTFENDRLADHVVPTTETVIDAR